MGSEGAALALRNDEWLVKLSMLERLAPKR